MSSNAAVQTNGLGKQFGSRWALADCSLEIPAGRICGLVGSNGAGKTTLLRMIAGLARPSAGEVRVFGRQPADELDFLRSVGFLAQEIPLYKRWSTADHLTMGERMNEQWDAGITRDRISALGIDLKQLVGTLSGGQRSQVALTMALGKRPRLLLLDEPVAALDPLARRDFLGVLAEAVADGDLTVVMSSHLVHDLERICDHVVLVDHGRLALATGLDDAVATHRLLTAPRRDTAHLERDHTVLRVENTARQTSVWLRLDGPLHEPGWEVSELGLEDIVLAYMGGWFQPDEPGSLGLAGVAGGKR